MKIRIISDIHAEFSENRVPSSHITPPMDGDQETVLVVAGDLGNYVYRSTYVPLLEDWSDQFESVIYIPGNHEFYGGDLFKGDSKIIENISHLHNVHYFGIDGGVVTINDIKFVCHPLFCSMGTSPGDSWMIWRALNDFGMIDVEGFPLRPEDYIRLFEDGCDFIFDQISEPEKTVVVTHWTPTFNSVHPRFQGSALNGGFSSDLDEEIYKYQPAVWIHGHTHDPYDYYMGNTRVICNPSGYNHERGFNPYLSIEV